MIIFQNTEQLLPCAAGDLFNLHAGQGQRVCGRDKRSWSDHGRGRCRQHLVDQGGLQGPFNAAAHQVTQRNLEDVLTCCFTWLEKCHDRSVKDQEISEEVTKRP